MPNPSERHTILVLDDEPDVVRSVQDLLRLDYVVLGATSASEAMDLMRDHEIHVVMTDQRMPGMTGVEFLRHVRGEHPDAIRLLFTGYSDMRAVIDSINQGNVYRYVTKPWDPEELETILREACERYDLIVQRKILLLELQRKNQELERANELKTAFIRVASHELRTPLTVLLGLAWMAERSPELPPAWHDRLRRIGTAGKRLQTVVDQISAMLWAGQFHRLLQRQQVALGELLQQAVDDVKPFAQLRCQRLQLAPADELGEIEIDPAKLRDCLNHVLLNAIKFTPDGGAITVSAARTAEGGAEIRVRDTGIGIDPETLAHVFEPFFTGFDTSHHTSGVYEFGRRGLGLGLSVVKAFVGMQGGEVAIQSEPQRGTTVTLTLPAAMLPVPLDPA